MVGRPVHSNSNKPPDLRIGFVRCPAAASSNSGLQRAFSGQRPSALRAALGPCDQLGLVWLVGRGSWRMTHSGSQPMAPAPWGPAGCGFVPVMRPHAPHAGPPCGPVLGANPMRPHAAPCGPMGPHAPCQHANNPIALRPHTNGIPTPCDPMPTPCQPHAACGPMPHANPMPTPCGPMRPIRPK
jgi:hypothetical protein